MIAKIYRVRRQADPRADQLALWLRQMGCQLTGLRIETVLRVEGITAEKLNELRPIFCNDTVEIVSPSSLLHEADGPIIEVSYRRAMTDPEMSSLVHAARTVGVEGLRWARLSTRYQIAGLTETAAMQIVSRFLCNEQVETIIPAGEEWSTLIPQGEVGGVDLIDLAPMEEEALQQLSQERRLHMPIEQLRAMREFFVSAGRQARDAEIEMIAAAWSDHCSHVTWRALGLFADLKEATRRINHPLVISAYVDNSGVMRFYGGWALNVKGETHISPTFAGSPYGGIMTKHGGVIRDIIKTGQGAWPWAGTTIMATGDPRLPWEQVPVGAFHPLVVITESIRGTKDYLNPMGIPMGWSQYLIDPRNWKGFALGHSVGVLPERRAEKGKPQPGDYLVLIGAPTGNDGLHGATVSSAKMTSETSRVDAAHVQIGMPIEERVFMEAIPVLRDADCIRACTDCGAAGLSSAVGEMGSETGVWVNLALVPLKCASMRPWQIWLSESQERGVLCVPEEKLEEALTILSDYEVPATVIGIFTDSGRCQVVYDAGQKDLSDWRAPSLFGDIAFKGTIVVNLPYAFLNGECPLPIIEVCEPIDKPRPFHPPVPRSADEWLEMVSSHLGHFNISDQAAAAHQYDQTVQGNTVLPYIGGVHENMPDELFVSTPVPNQPWGAGFAVAVNQFYADVDPATAGKLLMVQAMAKLVAAGFSPNDMVCNVNVYTPRVTDSPENAWRLVQLVRHGYVAASVELGLPIISGKDSSSGTFITESGHRIDAPLTLAVLSLGRMPDVRRLVRKPFVRAGDTLVLFHPGLRNLKLGGSVFLDHYGERGEILPDVDLVAFRRGMERYHFMLNHISSCDSVQSRSVVTEGGLIRRLFEMSLGSPGLGCSVDLPAHLMPSLFGEFNGAILFAARGNFWPLQREFSVLGQVIDQSVIEVTSKGKPVFRYTTDELSGQWAKTFREVVS